MKKTMKVLAMVLLFAMLVGMVGCGGSSAVAAEENDDAYWSNSWESEGDGNLVAGDYAPEDDYYEEEYIEPEPEDPCEALIVDEDVARSDGDGAYVIRNGKWYTVSYKKPGPYDPRHHDFGQVMAGKICWMYDSEVNETNNYISFGKVPVMTLRPDDKLIVLSAQASPTLVLYDIDFVGYTIQLVNNAPGWGSMGAFLYEDLEGEEITLPYDFEVRDRNDNVIKNYRDLDFGEVYTVSWFEGTNYNECSLEANSSFYVEQKDAKFYELKGKLSKESYASFDFSSVPPGLYRLSDGRGPFIYSIIRVE